MSTGYGYWEAEPVEDNRLPVVPCDTMHWAPGSMVILPVPGAEYDGVDCKVNCSLTEYDKEQLQKHGSVQAAVDAEAAKYGFDKGDGEDWTVLLQQALGIYKEGNFTTTINTITGDEADTPITVTATKES